LQGIHEKMIKVWPFLPVYLDANEILVHQGGRLEVFKALPLHDMAPMAGGIANAHKNWPVLLFGPQQRLLAPGIPINRIMGMLEQIRAGFVDEAVGIVHKKEPRNSGAVLIY
jgi:hypothetical protein